MLQPLVCTSSRPVASHVAGSRADKFAASPVLNERTGQRTAVLAMFLPTPLGCALQNRIIRLCGAEDLGKRRGHRLGALGCFTVQNGAGQAVWFINRQMQLLAQQ